MCKKINDNNNENNNDTRPTISIQLNGKAVEVPADITILEAAKIHGISIPTLCHNSRTKPFTSCFVCVVEVLSAKNLVPSCSVKVSPSMSIMTDSERVHKARKMALDLLLSDHNGDCLAPCHLHCPAHTDVQGYVAHIANGDYPAAVRLIKNRLALPVVCGTVCPNPCEEECRRTLVDEPIAIRALKRFASEYDLQKGPFIPKVKSDSGKKVAIVGGGPAGLAAAYYLRQDGHTVQINEALPQLGGMTRYGIPRFRLPWDKLDAEIKTITDLGIEVHTNRRLGKDFTISDLKQNGADAILITIGAHLSKSMGIENEHGPGVIGGVDFLRKVVLGEKIEMGSSSGIGKSESVAMSGRKKVAVVGGGDVAMDCARVARRLGTTVTLIYRRSQEEMPALAHEQHQTQEEGVEFRFLTAPVAVIRGPAGEEPAPARGLRVICMELGAPDESGRRRPVAIAGSEEDLAFDLIISAIGQDPDISCLANEKAEYKPATTKWKTLSYDSNSMCTNVPGVFTAGDCAFGPDTVVRALAEGKRAADTINLFLTGIPTGKEIKFSEEYHISKGRIAELNTEDFAPRFEHKKRAQETLHAADRRLSHEGYDPISIPFGKAKALAEAARCIECGCQARYDCGLRNLATEYHAHEKIYEGEKRKYLIDNRHPLLRFEIDKCITCGNCVRVCREVRNISALTFVNRGFKTHIAPNFEDALQNTGCDACGMCIDVCPTGTIGLNTTHLGKTTGPWKLDANKVITTCISCGKGCALEVYSNEGIVSKIQKVRSVDGDPTNHACICAEGRFAYQIVNEYRQNFSLSKKDLNHKINEAQNRLRTIGKRKGVAVVVSPWNTLEDLWAAHELAQCYSAKLYYLTDATIAGANAGVGANSTATAKSAGVANLFLLQQLKASALPLKKVSSTLDKKLIVAIGAYFPEKILPPTSLSQMIVLGNFTYSAVNKPASKTAIQIPVADPLESNGLFINLDGALCELKTSINSDNNNNSNLLSIHCIIANWCNNAELNNLKVIRKKLSNLIPEIDNFDSSGDKARLEIVSRFSNKQQNHIAPDSRAMAFNRYLKHLDL
ncbi:MAG: FAD-dependent oxidoreductase [Oligoflexia bacterium]|nr:FAD-dependent oxidoreductase [Oligoflexia bacterium]